MQSVANPKKEHTARQHRERDNFSTKTDDRNTIYTLFNTMGGPDTEPLVTTVSVNEAKLMMEVDTRASASVVDETAYCNTQQSSSHRR